MLPLSLSFTPSNVLPTSRVHTRILHQRRPVCRRRSNKPQFTARFNLDEPEPPDIIRHLDEMEKKHRENPGTPVTPMTKEAENALFEEFPSIRQLAKDMEGAMAVDDYDVEDWRVYSWAYRYLLPWAPSRFTQVLAAVVSYFAARMGVRTLRARFTTSQIVKGIIAFDMATTVILTALIPLVLVTWLLTRHRDDARLDGLTRTVIMFTLSSTALLLIAAIASTGNITIALLGGIFVRISMQLPALYFWEDLQQEVSTAPSLVAQIVRSWRWCTILCTIVAGTAVRLGSLADVFPGRSIIQANAERMRVYLGKRFPVALSLCNDPRGLFFGASLLMVFVACYITHLVIFKMDFGKNRKHRKLVTWLSKIFIGKGIYQPNVHPDEILGRISTPSNSSSYLPSSAMLLRHEDSVFELESGFLSTESIMPIITYLDNEDDILKKEGATQWMKPNHELVPISENMSEEKRALNGLLSWSQPLDSDEAELSFAEYFQTVQDDDYGYDEESGSWVFNNADLLGDPLGYDGNTTDASGVDLGNVNDTVLQNLDWANMPDIPVDDATIAEFASKPEFQPFIKRYMEEALKKQQEDEKGDEPSGPVFV